MVPYSLHSVQPLTKVGPWSKAVHCLENRVPFWMSTHISLGVLKHTSNVDDEQLKVSLRLFWDFAIFATLSEKH